MYHNNKSHTKILVKDVLYLLALLLLNCSLKYMLKKKYQYTFMWNIR